MSKENAYTGTLVSVLVVGLSLLCTPLISLLFSSAVCSASPQLLLAAAPTFFSSFCRRAASADELMPAHARGSGGERAGSATAVCVCMCSCALCCPEAGRQTDRPTGLLRISSGRRRTHAHGRNTESGDEPPATVQPFLSDCDTILFDSSCVGAGHARRELPVTQPSQRWPRWATGRIATDRRAHLQATRSSSVSLRIIRAMRFSTLLLLSVCVVACATLVVGDAASAKEKVAKVRGRSDQEQRCSQTPPPPQQQTQQKTIREERARQECGWQKGSEQM